jgi:predicted ATPase
MEYASVQLFVDRAQTVRPEFRVTARNAAAVAALCRQLEGLPLALELAGARAGLLTPAQMLQQLGNRFDFLIGRRRKIPPRHRTLRDAVEWSFRLLPPKLQEFFECLSVFRGGFTLEAAGAVCLNEGVQAFGRPGLQGRQGVQVFGCSCVQEGRFDKSAVAGPEDLNTRTPEHPPLSVGPERPTPNTPTPAVLDFLEQLREWSLVVVEEAGEEYRYRLLEALREYAAEQLAHSGRAEAVRCRHAHYFLQFAEAAEPQLIGPNQSDWFDRLERDHDNLRVALEWHSTDGRWQSE